MLAYIWCVVGRRYARVSSSMQYSQDHMEMISSTCKRSVMRESSDRLARLYPGQNQVGCISDNQSYLSIIDNNYYPRWLYPRT